MCGRRGRGTQVGVNVSQSLRQQGGDVGVDGGEPGVGAGAVFTAQHHCVLAVRGMELQEPEGTKKMSAGFFYIDQSKHLLFCR